RGPRHRSADAPASCRAVRGAGLARERQWRGPHCRIQRAERRTAAVESLRSQADDGVRRRYDRAIGSDAVAVRHTRWRPDLAEDGLRKTAVTAKRPGTSRSRLQQRHMVAIRGAWDPPNRIGDRVRLI